jgi:hypothetical protein
VLQEQVQWAVLEKSSTASDAAASSGEDESQQQLRNNLEMFVSSFDLACQSHALELKLEQIGHPDWQSRSCRPRKMGNSCRLEDMNILFASLNQSLNEWNNAVEEACRDCPRLALLGKLSRVQLLMNLRERLDSSSAHLLLPYVMQCFPDAQITRKELTEDVARWIARLAPQFIPDIYATDSISSLRLAIDLIRFMSANLGESWSEVKVSNEAITKLELFSCKPLDIYCHHLHDMIANYGRPGMPGMVLWGHSGINNWAIDDLLAVVASGLCPTVHVLHVDKLPARIRDYLLRGLHSTPIRCPVLLIFGDREGSDGFGHIDYPVELKINRPADYAKSFYASRSRRQGLQAADGGDGAGCLELFVVW